jgi:protein SCO1/2
MTKQPKTYQRLLFLLISIAVLSALFGMWMHYNTQNKTGSPALKTATIFSQPRTIAPFKLVDTDNKPFSLENLKGHYTLIFFGFTHCPDLCPTTLAMLSQSYKMLESAQLKSMPRILFISVDPEQDTSQVIKTYLSSFNTAFLGATGSQKQLDKLTQEMSVIYAKVSDAKDPTHYTIDHSGTIIIINPEGQFYGVFTMPHDPQKIANDMKALLNQNNV